MENNASNRIHPLVAGAAISVMLVSLTGVAAMTGLIPQSHGSSQAAAATVAAVPVTASALTPGSSQVTTATSATSSPLVETRAPALASSYAEPNPASASQRHRSNASPSNASQPVHTPYQQARTHSSPPSSAVAQAPRVCHECGRIESVQAIQHEVTPSGMGMVAGAVLGGVLGNQVGGGNGRKLATVAGAVGGGYAGNEIEKRTRTTTTYQVRVRMDNGNIRTFPYSQQPAWSTGDRVKVVDGQLTSRV